MAVDETLKELNSIKNRALRSVKMARSRASLEAARQRYLGPRGQITVALQEVASLESEARALANQIAGSVRSSVLQAVAEKDHELAETEQDTAISEQAVDVTLSAIEWPVGHIHPLTLAAQEIESLFRSMGFAVAAGPEIESDYHNFEALNMPRLHPDREDHAPLLIGKDGLLRTHVSPARVRAMMETAPPMAFVCRGRAYRRAAREGALAPMFHQIEGVMADESIRFSDLKGVLGTFVAEFIGPDTPMRFRPSYCPFTEPSCVLDVYVHDPRIEDLGEDERVWTQIASAGMVHPAVFEQTGHDPAKITGFSFAAEIERLAMIRYGIPDAALFYENDVRFLRRCGWRAV